MKFYYTYVLLSLKDLRFYIGFSRNIYRRFEQHQNGLVKSTASRRPFKLIYYEAHLNKDDAIRRESYFKTNSGKRTLKQMLRHMLSSVNL